ncbi:MAG: peptide ABC transporter substrate-binding protein [Desulfobulbus propionicus]|nr:MAG: peptide ABC transporter substrate-binding protein [Desulfobulbus propionicus]
MSELRNLERMLQLGKISRRDFMVAAAAMGVSAAVSSTVLPSTAQAAEQPKRGGRLRLGLNGGATSDTMDPGILYAMMPQLLVSGTLGNKLVEIDADGKAIPELAESWEFSPDAKTWVFKLRKGVEFHDGKTMDADDVIYSLNWHRQEGTKSAAKTLVESITEMKKVDKFTIIFELDSGSADFPYVLSDYHLVIGPNETDLARGVFTGPYVLKSFEPGVRALTTRNPNYFKSNRAWFDEVEIIGINDVNARTNALKTGQIDVMNRCDLKTVHLFKRMPGIQVMRQDGYKHLTFAMRTDIAPYNNNDVRLALKYAIDREQMVKTILRGYGQVGNDHPISVNDRFHADKLPQRQYDPDKAKFHLKKAGLENATFKLHAAEAAFKGAVNAGVLFKEHAAKAGINIDVVREPNDGYWSNVWMKKPWSAVFWGGRATADMMFTTAYAKGASWNDTFWDNARFNELLIAARAEMDEAKRKTMYVEMQKLVRDEGGAVIPMFSSDLAAATDKIGYNKLGVDWELDGFRAPERWWFKS